MRLERQGRLGPQLEYGIVFIEPHCRMGSADQEISKAEMQVPHLGVRPIFSSIHMPVGREKGKRLRQKGQANPVQLLSLVLPFQTYFI